MRMLKQEKTGKIWPWTKALAARPDMKEIQVEEPKATPEEIGQVTIDPEELVIPDVDKMTKRDLIALARAKGIEVNSDWRRDRILGLVKERMQ